MSGRRPGLGRTAGLISMATMLSRVLGLVREQLFAALLGATAMADAFVAAFRIPNLLRDLFAEGALSQAFVPTFKGELRKRRRRAAPTGSATPSSATCSSSWSGSSVCAGVFFAPEIVLLMAHDYDEVPGQVRRSPSS